MKSKKFFSFVFLLLILFFLWINWVQAQEQQIWPNLPEKTENNVWASVLMPAKNDFSLNNWNATKIFAPKTNWALSKFEWVRTQEFLAKTDKFWNDEQKNLRELWYKTKDEFISAFAQAEVHRIEFNKTDWGKKTTIDENFDIFVNKQRDVKTIQTIQERERINEEKARTGIVWWWENWWNLNGAVKITKVDEENIESSLLMFFGVNNKNEAINKWLLPDNNSWFMQNVVLKIYSFLYAFYVILASAIIIIFIFYLVAHSKWILWKTKNASAVWKVEDMLIAFSIIILVLFWGFKLYLWVINGSKNAIEEDLRGAGVNIQQDKWNQNMSFDVTPNWK